MQQGAIGLLVATIINAVPVIITPCYGGINLFIVPVMVIIMYTESWTIWANFLNETPEELYCVEGSTLVDVIYGLLPVALGLWRLGWAAGGNK
jgi:hypothetical protein